MLRHSHHALTPHVEDLLAEDRARICGLIAAELTQGAVTSKELSVVEELTRSIPLLEGTEQTWIEAGRWGRTLREKGVTVGLLDCYLAVMAKTHGCLLLSLDKHFTMIAKHFPLELDTISST